MTTTQFVPLQDSKDAETNYDALFTRTKELTAIYNALPNVGHSLKAGTPILICCHDHQNLQVLSTMKVLHLRPPVAWNTFPVGRTCRVNMYLFTHELEHKPDASMLLGHFPNEGRVAENYASILLIPQTFSQCSLNEQLDRPFHTILPSGYPALRGSLLMAPRASA